MRILSIGNSFSSDATRYVHDIAASAGEEMTTINLYIGGCSLERHWNNVLEGKAEYLLEVNGVSTERYVSLQEMLDQEFYDIITVQQASHESIDYQRYTPYIQNMVNWLNEHADFGEIVIHQTWAYEQDSKRLNEELGYADHKDMFSDIKKAYEQAAKETGIRRIIPCGQVFQDLLADGLGKIHRDTFHALIPLGRYVLGLVWFETLTGKSAELVTYCPEGLNPVLARAISGLVHGHLIR